MTEFAPIDRRSPESQLAFVARVAASRGMHEVAGRILSVAKRVRVSATTEIDLTSWDDFRAWFDKNRTQGAEFTMADTYGEGSPEAQEFSLLLEAYDLADRKCYEYYLKLKGEDAPSDLGDSDSVVDAVEDVVQDEVVEDLLGEGDIGLSEDIALEDTSDLEITEEPSEAEDAMSLDEEDSTEARVEAMLATLRQSNLSPLKAIYRSASVFRVAFGTADEIVRASDVLTDAGYGIYQSVMASGVDCLDVTI